jgi:uracil-DNA glycosylase
VALIGEAPGYRGARRSGVPFTSEHQLLGHGMRKATATIVHQVLAELNAEARVLLWNAVPYHPHRLGEPQSNRRPTTAEIAECQKLLETVIADRIPVAVGGIADRTLQQLGVRAAIVRHSANGGKTRFAAGLAAALRAELAAR